MQCCLIFYAGKNEFEEKQDKIPKYSRIVVKFQCGAFLAPFIVYFIYYLVLV